MPLRLRTHRFSSFCLTLTYFVMHNTYTYVNNLCTRGFKVVLHKNSLFFRRSQKSIKMCLKGSLQDP